MTYDLTLAGPDGDAAVKASRGSGGVYHELGADVDRALRAHPLAKAELGRPKGFDHVHLSIVDGTNFVRWMGRASDGWHHQIGRTMRLIRMASQIEDTDPDGDDYADRAEWKARGGA